MKLEKLTPEQEALLPQHLKDWTNLSRPLDREKATAWVKWLYKETKLKEPMIVFVSSPMACQYAIPTINECLELLGQKKKEEQVWEQVRDQVRDQVWEQVRKDNLKIYSFAHYGSIWDYGWCSFYSFFREIVILQHEKFNEFVKLKETGLYDMIQLDGLCVVCEMPSRIVRDERNRLHCESGPSIEWSDGYKLWFYHGMSVPQRWVEDKDSITPDEVKKEANAEKRRALRDLLGPGKYFDVLGGVNEIDRDMDNQGNEMILYESKINDSVINKKVQYLEVICPSTKRKYILYPPNQTSKNVWEAKASTFNNEPIQIRHGDVGLRNLEKAFGQPICES